MAGVGADRAPLDLSGRLQYIRNAVAKDVLLPMRLSVLTMGVIARWVRPAAFGAAAVAVCLAGSAAAHPGDGGGEMRFVEPPVSPAAVTVVADPPASATPVGARPVVSTPVEDDTDPAHDLTGEHGHSHVGEHAHAEEGTDDGENMAADYAVTVTGKFLPVNRGVGDQSIKVGKLAEVPRRNASQLLTLAPGVMLTNHGGEGHADQVFLRGFDAREGQDIEFSVDGMVVNDANNPHGNGYADLHFIIPELVESVRVMAGPFDPRQGNFAVAGSVDYHLGLAQRGVTTKYTGGSFNTHRLVLLWGPKTLDQHTFAGAELYTTDGFGPNRKAQRASVIGQHEGEFPGGARYRLMTQAYIGRFASAGVVRQDDYDAGRIGFFGTYDPRQGGDSQRYSLNFEVAKAFDDLFLRQQFFLAYRSLRLAENFTGFLLDGQTQYQQPHGQRGDLQENAFGGTTIGLRGSARYRRVIGSLPQEFEAGYYARGDISDAQQYRLDAATGAPYKTESDIASKTGDIGLFADLNARPLNWMGILGGVRADMFGYDVLNRCAVKTVRKASSTNPPGDASCFSQQALGDFREPYDRLATATFALMPRGSLVFGPFEGVKLSGSVGRGVRSIDPIYVTDNRETPFASVFAYEGGALFERTLATPLMPVQFSARAGYFETRVSKDLIFSEIAGRNTLGGASTRRGAVTNYRVTGAFFDHSTSFTYTRATFDDTGLLIPYVPDVVVRSDTAFFGDLPVKIDGSPLRMGGAVGITFIGPRPIPFGQRADIIFVTDVGLTFGWRFITVNATVRNLFNTQYKLAEFNYASDFRSQGQPTLVPARHFSAGEPLGVFGSIAFNFGGGQGP
jgi:iron complex outermembrane recepter protein